MAFFKVLPLKSHLLFIESFEVLCDKLTDDTIFDAVHLHFYAFSKNRSHVRCFPFNDFLDVFGFQIICFHFV